MLIKEIHYKTAIYTIIDNYYGDACYFRYCEVEAKLAFCSKIPIVAARFEEGYDADAEDDWINLITTGALKFDCSTDAIIVANIERYVKELKSAYFLFKCLIC